MPASIFDRTALKIKPLSQRIHDLSREVVLDLEQPTSLEHQDELKSVAESIIAAKEKGSKRRNRTSRVLPTDSNMQAGKPIHRSAINHWKAHEKRRALFFEALGTPR